MLSELRTWAVISITAVIWVALVAAGVVTGNGDAISMISTVIPLLLIGAGLFEKWGWRWQGLHPLLVDTPVLAGTWKGELESLWVDGATGKTPPKKGAYLVVEQSMTTIKVRFLTDESASDQLAGSINKLASGHKAISYTYLNTPGIEYRPGSPIHYGGAALEIFGDPPTRLAGEYWNERQGGKGKITLREHSPKIAQAFEDAEGMSFETRGGT